MSKVGRYDQSQYQFSRRIQLKNPRLNLAHHARLSVDPKATIDR